MQRLDSNIFELQSLELRRFLAVNVTLSGNTLNIVGDNSSEFITVNRNGSNRLTVTGWGPTFAIGNGSGQVNQISLTGQGGNDTILLTNNVRFPSNNAGIPATLAGGNGNDTITGGPGNETLSGNDGNDVMDGGVGNDLITGGSGVDTTNYSNRPTAIRVTNNNNADADGEIGIPENDKVETEEVIGGLGNDTLTGTGADDFLAGGAGNDCLVGGGGNDELTGNTGVDILRGEAGDDFLQAQNQDRDTVNGGTGPGATDNDLASIDGIDVPALTAIHGSASDLDETYGNSGRAFGDDLGWSPMASAVDSQGRVVFVGSHYFDNGLGYGYDFAVARFTADGSGYDSTFGSGGVEYIDFSDVTNPEPTVNSPDFAKGVAIGPNDSIIVVGYTQGDGYGSDFAVANLTSAGQPMTGWGDSGRAVVDAGFGAYDEAVDAVVQSDGKVVVVGRVSDDGNDAAAVRFGTNGLLDVNFGTGYGIEVFDLGSFDDEVTGIALQSLSQDDGAQRIVVVGHSNGFGAIARLTPSGLLDSTFAVGGPDDINGVHWEDLSGGNFQTSLWDVAVDPSDNAIIVAGQAGALTITLVNGTPSPAAGTIHAVLGKFDSEGTLVDSASHADSSGFAVLDAVTVDAQGRYVAAGQAGSDYLVARATSDMEPDEAFGTDGATTTDFNESYDGAKSVRVLDDGRIVVGGNRIVSEATLPTAARYNGDSDVPPIGEGDVEEVEDYVKNEDFQNPSPELEAILNKRSDSGKLYIIAQPDSNGVAHIPLDNHNNRVNIYNVIGGDGEPNVAVDIDGIVIYYHPDTTTRIDLKTLGGNDIVTAGNSILIPLLIDAGSGNDIVVGGGANDVVFGGSGIDLINGNAGSDALLGGSGADLLYGDGDRDILIGGAGPDAVIGGDDEDIDIGGTTAYDNDVDALDSLIAEWSSTETNANRIFNLRNGGGLNGTNVLTVGSGATVFNDNVIDVITNDSGRDWFFIRNTGSFFQRDQVLFNTTGEEISLV